MEFVYWCWEFVCWCWERFAHLDKTLDTLGTQMGDWLYVVLFAILFCETGLVVTPFLPGDSLLFALGALTATGVLKINIVWASVLMIIAAVIGDAVNYSIGKKLGAKVFKREDSWLLNKKHLEEAHRFYEKHGGKTIILARFIPIIRTFAPFVAGIGKMSYFHFALYNVTGAIAWVVLLVLAGRFFGEQPFVKDHFELVILAIVGISVLPVVWHAIQARRRGKLEASRINASE